jgi:hypothetical protein
MAPWGWRPFNVKRAGGTPFDEAQDKPALRNGSRAWNEMRGLSAFGFDCQPKNAGVTNWHLAESRLCRVATQR